MGCVYRIVSAVNGKVYVGSTVLFQKRRLEHLHHLRKNKHHSPIMQNSFNKYGEDSLQFEVLEEVRDNAMLLEREQHWMDTLQPEFNCSPTARSPLGVKHSAEARRNMSIAHQGIRPTKEALAKRSLKQSGHNHWCYGKQLSAKIRQKIAKSVEGYYSTHPGSRTGSVVNETTRQKIRESLYKPVLQCNKDGEVIKRWSGIKEAAESLGMHSSNICRCLKGKQKICYGFTWRYADD